MIILLFFAFISGLVTILAPCIWPLLPIILSSTATGGHKKPLGITLGIITSFAFFTLTLSYILKIFPFDPNILRLLAVIIIGFLGLSLIIPQLTLITEGFVSRLSNKIGIGKNQGNGFYSGLLTGLSLGIVWTPCAGPILATIATLAATQAVNFKVILVTLFYVSGVGVPLFFFATFGQILFKRIRGVSAYTGSIQKIFGLIMILTALAILTNYDRIIETNLLNYFPSFSQGLNFIEGQSVVQNGLNSLKGTNGQTNLKPNDSSLPILGKAADFVGISNWLNSQPLTLADLKGKVVLVDFWTYTCINCIRTLPFVTSWYDKYHDKGFMVIGVHTPEFEFEKNTQNVQNAIKQYNIHYPVAQDNNYATWQNYNNIYWPAEYLIDGQGNVRRTHFGEGEYDQTEMAIQKLLAENGENSQMPLTNLPDQTPQVQLSPETYLNLVKLERFGSAEEPKNGEQNYTLAKNLSLNYWALGGNWDVQDEYAVASNGSSLEFNFLAGKVFLVITPATNSDTVKVSLDGKLINTITATEAKLYTLVDLKDNVGQHLLHLDFMTPGTKVYAFTFGS